MIKYGFQTLIFVICVALVSGCDIIEYPYNEKANSGHGTSDFERTDTIFVKNEKKVLLEDFTGFRCGNCPEASETADDIYHDYPEQVVVMKVHVGDLAAPAPPLNDPSYDYRCEVGDEIDANYNISPGGIPKGMINRIKYNGSAVLGLSAWGNVLNQELEKEPYAILKLHSIYNEENGELDLQIQLNYLSDRSANDHLVLYILEDEIESIQLDYRIDPPIIDPFVHSKMLRGTINPTWGNPISDYLTEELANEVANTGKIPSDTKLFTKFNYSFNDHPNWVAKNCKIVAVLYDNATKEVVQVNQVKVVSH